ncbi:MAG: hypothetical protein WC728_15330 [Elusimicrobiota bacterium]
MATLILILLCASASADGFEAVISETSRAVSERMQASRQEGGVLSKAERCAPEGEGDPKLYSSDFRWDYTLPEMRQRFEEIYASPKRLGQRAYWNEKAGRYELPNDRGGGPVALPESYIKAVARHIEAAFEKDVIDGVFFPDMGHSHLLIPQELWDSKYGAYPSERTSQFYTDVFSDPRVMTFYHTAEQLKARDADGTLVADERTRMRYQTRNIAGANTADAELHMYQNPESNANTVRQVPGYSWYGAGFNLSANQNGCFSYTVKGRTFYFDISLKDVEPPPGSGGGDF